MEKWDRVEEKIEIKLEWLEKRIRNHDLEDFSQYEGRMILITNSVWRPVYDASKETLYLPMSALWMGL